MAIRCTTALVEPPTAASATIALWNDSRVITCEMVRPSRTRSTASLPDACAPCRSRLSGAGVPARPGMVMPSASAMMPIDEAVPIVLQWPRLRIIEDSDWMNSSLVRAPARTSSPRRQTSVPQPSACPRNVPFSIGPPGTTTAGRSDARRGHQQRGDRLVAAAEQHQAVDRVGPEHLLHGHRGHVPPQHRGGPDERLAEGDHGQVERDAARLVHAALDRLRDLVQVRVAGRQVGGGVRDGDLRPALERVRGHPAAHPGAVQVGVAVVPGVPRVAPQRRLRASVVPVVDRRSWHQYRPARRRPACRSANASFTSASGRRAPISRSSGRRPARYRRKIRGRSSRGLLEPYSAPTIRFWRCTSSLIGTATVASVRLRPERDQRALGSERGDRLPHGRRAADGVDRPRDADPVGEVRARAAPRRPRARRSRASRRRAAASSSLAGSTSTTITGSAPTRTAPMTAASPTPPAPTTSSGRPAAVLDRVEHRTDAGDHRAGRDGGDLGRHAVRHRQRRWSPRPRPARRSRRRPSGGGCVSSPMCSRLVPSISPLVLASTRPNRHSTGLPRDAGRRTRRSAAATAGRPGRRRRPGRWSADRGPRRCRRPRGRPPAAASPAGRRSRSAGRCGRRRPPRCGPGTSPGPGSSSSTCSTDERRAGLAQHGREHQAPHRCAAGRRAAACSSASSGARTSQESKANESARASSSSSSRPRNRLGVLVRHRLGEGDVQQQRAHPVEAAPRVRVEVTGTRAPPGPAPAA